MLFYRQANGTSRNWKNSFILRLFSNYSIMNRSSTAIQEDCEVSLRSSSQQPPGIHICQMRSASAVNRTRDVGSVTCVRWPTARPCR